MAACIDYAEYGMALFAGLLLWVARGHRGLAAVSATLWAPLGTLLAVGRNSCWGTGYTNRAPTRVCRKHYPGKVVAGLLFGAAARLAGYQPVRRVMHAVITMLAGTPLQVMLSARPVRLPAPASGR